MPVERERRIIQRAVQFERWEKEHRDGDYMEGLYHFFARKLEEEHEQRGYGNHGDGSRNG